MISEFWELELGSLCIASSQISVWSFSSLLLMEEEPCVAWTAPTKLLLQLQQARVFHLQAVSR